MALQRTGDRNAGAMYFPNAGYRLHRPIGRFRDLVGVVMHSMSMHANKDDLISEVRKENERLRAALEEVARVAADKDRGFIDVVEIAHKALIG